MLARSFPLLDGADGDGNGEADGAAAAEASPRPSLEALLGGRRVDAGWT